MWLPGFGSGRTKLVLHRRDDEIGLKAADAHPLGGRKQSLPGREPQHALLQFSGDNLCKAAGIA